MVSPKDRKEIVDYLSADVRKVDEPQAAAMFETSAEVLTGLIKSFGDYESTRMSRQDHWQAVYTSKGESDVSWFQESPGPSLDLIALAGATASSAVIDIGGGASRLVDALVAMGFGFVSVLDLSEAAVTTAKARMRSEAGKVTWIVADVTIWQPEGVFDIWHDRAAFHFLTDEDDRAAYISRLTTALKPGGHAIIATFAPDGPDKCSGLPVMRYDAESLGRTLGSAFKLVECRRQAHVTPWNSVQQFQFSLFRFMPESIVQG